ncbi:transmembrane protein 180 isoform X4 [Lutra lutra]|uniref:transmembrane protein 180 isoform X4 n=1 Tax=Lutra lutra TaxID=9657 RepID=UPI001FD4E5DA|nr:transmembrane protein 180 isoform X4 [Lutra lutra]
MGLGRLQAWMLGLPTAVVYGSLALFISILHNVFLLYYVDTFVSVYKINKAAFWVGETVFLLWNSLNDPLFGWLSDRHFLSSQPRLCGEELLTGRQDAGSVTLGQYLQQLARHRNFLWFVGMDLVQSASGLLPAPLQPSSLLTGRWVAGLSLPLQQQLLPPLPGASVVRPHLPLHGLLPVGHLLRGPPPQQPLLPALVPALGRLRRGAGALPAQAGPEPAHAVGRPRPPRPPLPLHCQVCAALPHPLHLRSTRSSLPLPPPPFFAGSNRVFTEGTCKLLTLVVTDLVDEDLVLNRRKQAASALLFGMVALVTKPGQTFAPLLGTWLLCFYTGHDLFQQPPLTPVGSAQPWPEPPAPAPAQAPTLRQGCFYLLVLVPITCALLQLFTWSQFTLHGRRLHMVKAQRQNLSRAQTLDVKMV